MKPPCDYSSRQYGFFLWQVRNRKVTLLFHRRHSIVPQVMRSKSVYSVGITIDLNDKHFFEIKHSSLPLAFEHATIFCHTNRIFDKRCPTQIMSKIFSRNSLQYSQQNIESILANGYFTLEQKLQAYKLQIDFAGEIEKYELLKLINNGDCYSTKVDEQNAMRRDTISKAQLTHAQIEFNNLFGRSSFGQV